MACPNTGRPSQSVEKAQRACSTRSLHDGRSAASVVRSVISEAHVPGNDGFDFSPAMRGGNSARLFTATRLFNELDSYPGSDRPVLNLLSALL